MRELNQYISEKLQISRNKYNGKVLSKNDFKISEFTEVPDEFTSETVEFYEVKNADGKTIAFSEIKPKEWNILIVNDKTLENICDINKYKQCMENDDDFPEVTDYINEQIPGFIKRRYTYRPVIATFSDWSKSRKLFFKNDSFFGSEKFDDFINYISVYL